MNIKARNNNVKVHFVKRDDSIETVEAPEYATVMEAARYYSKDNYIETIDAECNGSCACATCHVIVDEKWRKKIPAPKDSTAEHDLLDYEPLAKEGSRLSCQIVLDKKLDGLIVHIPK